MMILKRFEEARTALYEEHVLTWSAGDAPETLATAIREIAQAPRPLVLTQASILAHIWDHMRLAFQAEEIFAGCMDHGNVSVRLRAERMRAMEGTILKPVLDATRAGVDAKAYSGDADFSHTCPDWRRLLSLGYTGIAADARARKAARPLSEDACAFYDAVDITYSSGARLFERFACLAPQPFMARALHALSVGAPQNTYEALQLILMHYTLQTHIEGTIVRSLGGLDQLLHPFIKRDLAEGMFTEDEIDELLRYFMSNLDRRRFGANIPFYLSGYDREGRDVTNATSFRIIRVYCGMGFYSPKMQICVNPQTPDDFLRPILASIRAGSNSFVFINDDVVSKGLERLGEDPRDARDYVPVGCYEPMAFGREIPCSCNGIVNAAKAVEAALNGGMGMGASVPPAEDIADFDGLLEAVAAQLDCFADRSMERIRAYEQQYAQIGASPLLSGTYESCMQNGRDAYAGGAQYGNSSINIIGIATAADALAAIQTLVYTEKRMTLAELRDVLHADWHGYERLRMRAKHGCPKFGNRDASADALAKFVAEHACAYICGQPNGRGGVFRAGLFSIDWILSYGAATGATADGRKAGEPLSKNLCPSVACDFKGITATVDSVTTIDHTLSPNGNVYDAMLHPSAIQGSEGIDHLLALVRVFMEKGGFALQINVFDAETLKRAQREPEKYATLQVRVCGWNAYFVDLSALEQNLFIRQAEGL